MIAMKKMLVMMLVGVAPVSGGDFLRELSADRPDATESPNTVEAGRFQIESSLWSYERDTVPGVRMETWVFGESNLKVGLTEDMDLQWVDGPGYDRVFVGGVGAGVFGPVTITGRAGGSIAPQVTHPLITAAEAHRQRGMAELAAAASRVERQIRLQVLPATGIMVPGVVLDDVDGSVTRRGIVRSTQVDWAGPSLRQTLGVEYHEVP